MSDGCRVLTLVAVHGTDRDRDGAEVRLWRAGSCSLESGRLRQHGCMFDTAQRRTASQAV